MSDRPIVFLDTETTGLHADRRPWEIAWIRREPNGTETERLLQIRDVDLSNAELKGLQIGGFYDRWYGTQAPPTDWRKGWTIREGDPTEFTDEYHAAQEVERATRNAIIVGAVPNFDTETLAPMLRRYEMCPAWHYQLVDIEALAAGWLTGHQTLIPGTEALEEARLARFEAEQCLRQSREPFSGYSTREAESELVRATRAEAHEQRKAVAEFLAPPWRSDDLSRACGVEPPTPEERHTALGDARWVKRWYDHIMGGA